MINNRNILIFIILYSSKKQIWKKIRDPSDYSNYPANLMKGLPIFYLPQKVYDISRSDDVQMNSLTPGVNKMKKRIPNIVTFLCSVFDGIKLRLGERGRKFSTVIISHMSSGKVLLFIKFSAIFVNPTAALSVIITLNFVKKKNPAFVVTFSPDDVAQTTSEKWKRKLCEMGKWNDIMTTRSKEQV